ncbi:hypothetical protein [Paraburkholderia mimosarum]|nr:hypothetical protein [Paraburkholderia mimosarum]
MNLHNTGLNANTEKLDELRSTQIAVGCREVGARRAHWNTLGKRSRAKRS